MPDGYVSKDALVAHRLLPSADGEEGSFAAAHKYEWRRKPKLALGPQSSIQEWQQAAAKHGQLGRIRRRAALWRVLEELLEGPDDVTGRPRLGVDDDARYVRLFLRKEINQAFAELPHIHADATMSTEIVSHFLPRLTNALDVDIEAPHADLDRARSPDVCHLVRDDQVMRRADVTTAPEPGPRDWGRRAAKLKRDGR